MMLATNALTAAAVLSVLASFENGMKQLDARQYAASAAAFEPVCGSPAVLPDLADLARAYRAEALLGVDPAKGRAALKEAYGAVRFPPARARVLSAWQAAKLGEPKDLLPAESPNVAWNDMIDLVRRDKEPEARARIGGSLADLLMILDFYSGMMGRQGRSLFQEIARQNDVRFIASEERVEEGVAEVRVGDEDDMQMLLECRVEDGRWKFTRLSRMIPLGRMAAQMAARGGGAPAMPSGARPPDPAPAEVSASMRDEVIRLIGELASTNAAVRGRARARLKEIGAAARPFLREQTGNSDPEISQSARELLGE